MERTVAMAGQDVYAAVLADAARALDEAGMPFHLLYGTALGAIRDKQFIEHDYDIDLGIMRADHVDDFCLGFENHRFTSCRWFGKLDDGLQYQFLHQKSVRLDISVMYDRPDGFYAASYGCLCERLPGRKCWYKNSKYALVDTSFAGGVYRVPEEVFFEETYGSDWRTPRKFIYGDDAILNDYKSLVGREELLRTLAAPKPRE